MVHKQALPGIEFSLSYHQVTIPKLFRVHKHALQGIEFSLSYHQVTILKLVRVDKHALQGIEFSLSFHQVTKFSSLGYISMHYKVLSLLFPIIK